MDKLDIILREAKYKKTVRDKNFTMKKLAEISGVPTTLLNTIFYQGYVPPAKTLLRLAQALDIPPIDILVCRKKLTPEMEERLFSKDIEILKQLYQNTYWCDFTEFPSEFEKNSIADRSLTD